MRHCWFIACLISPSVVATLLAPVEGLYASEKYSISYLPSLDWDKFIVQNASALSSGNIMELGDNLSCYVPTVTAQEDDKVEELNQQELEAVLVTNLRDGIDLITQSFAGCISYLSGFWNYELCSDTGLAQFHGNSKTTSLYYQLGRSKSSTTEREFQLLYNDLGYYISEVMGSGDICDVTGRPRVVEVQYICRPATVSPTIQWVREVKTCHYEIQVAVPQLCSLELLSKSEGKEVSGHIVCSKAEESHENSGVLDLIGYYKPTFIGNELYLLEPHYEESSRNRTALMYSGKTPIQSEEDSYGINEKFGNAIGRMLFQNLLLAPDGSPYGPGDKFAWMSEVLDSNGRLLTMVSFNLSSSLAEIVIDDTLRFTSYGNFIFYERSDNQNIKNDNLLEGKLATAEGKDGFAVFDADSLYLLNDANVKEIVENLVGSVSDVTEEALQGD